GGGGGAKRGRPTRERNPPPPWGPGPAGGQNPPPKAPGGGGPSPPAKTPRRFRRRSQTTARNTRESPGPVPPHHVNSGVTSGHDNARTGPGAGPAVLDAPEKAAGPPRQRGARPDVPRRRGAHRRGPHRHQFRRHHGGAGGGERARAAGPHPRPRRLLRRDGADRPLPPVGEDHRRDGAALPAVRLVDLPPVRHAAPGDGLGAPGDDGATRPRRRSPLRAGKPAYGLDRRN